jgi:hypothetical protein
LAEAAKQLIEAEAKRLTEEARRKEGKYCLSQMEFLEDRGLEADYLRENDGPSRFYVEVINTIPENHYGARHYE